MQLNVRLNKNFTTQYNKLQAEFGTELAKLNGFDDDQLSYSDFIDNFIDKDTVADSSIDGNSNVNHKDIVTLLYEMSKPHQKLLAFNKIYYEMQKKYGFKTANDWLRSEWVGELYMHDANTSTFKSYCYGRQNNMTVRWTGDNGDVREEDIEFPMFFEKSNFNSELPTIYYGIKLEEKYDETIEQNALFPEDLYVKDLVNGEQVWTKVLRIVKHANDKPMYSVQYNHRESQVVTEDHPIITERGEISAKEVQVGDQVRNWKNELMTVTEVRDDDPQEEVYDITTETGHFISNGILSHNCFAYDLSSLAEKGLFFIGKNFNAEPPKHLTTFVDFVKEFISYTSNRTSGAVGLPNLIPYLFYFWHKDVEDDYLGIKSSHNEEAYAKQAFQRFIYAVNQPYTRD